ncbi:MAG TPA: hypothetical protein VNV62_22925 [Trebonia sp.]|jgi:hypothetical protein|nr:hypothetical protein [Trebonia sp.]
MTIFVGITLTAVGAILLDVRVVGIVLILAGCLCLLLSPLVGTVSRQQRRRNPDALSVRRDSAVH